MDLPADSGASPLPIAVPAGLLPSFVAQHWHLLREVETCREVTPAAVQLPDAILGAAPKRRREFVAGRHCALVAVNRCRPSPAVEAIPIGENRAPQWPSGIVGSITHTNGLAWAAAALSEHAGGVGIDCEPVASERLARELWPTIASQAELDIMRAACWPLAVAFTLTFSAKESLFKCLYPDVRRYFDYRDAELSVADAGVVRRVPPRAATAPGHAAVVQ